MADIYDVLFDKIIRGDYEQGEKLKEDELSAEFGVSRTPVREAIRLLARDGLVELQPKRSAKVIGINADDVEEIYEIRRSLEILALRYSMPFLYIQGLKELREEIRQSAKSDDVDTIMRADENFHNYFIQASGKRRLITILEQMYQLLHHFRQLGFQTRKARESATRFHLALIDALSIRDLEAAERILNEHLIEGKKITVSYIINGQ